MSNTKKPENQNPNASAVELEESDLNEISGGPDTYIKFDGVDGESLKPSEGFQKILSTSDIIKTRG